MPTKGMGTLGGSLALSYRAKPIFSIRSSHSSCTRSPRDMKTHFHTKTCKWMFIRALFVIAQTRKTPGCLSHLHVSDRTVASPRGGTIRSSEKEQLLLPGVCDLRLPKRVLLRDRSQTQKDAVCLAFWKSPNYRLGRNISGCQGRGGGGPSPGGRAPVGWETILRGDKMPYVAIVTMATDVRNFSRPAGLHTMRSKYRSVIPYLKNKGEEKAVANPTCAQRHQRVRFQRRDQVRRSSLGTCWRVDGTEWP